jgi:hypothetical protein
MRKKWGMANLESMLLPDSGDRQSLFVRSDRRLVVSEDAGDFAIYTRTTVDARESEVKGKRHQGKEGRETGRTGHSSERVLLIPTVVNRS